MLVINLKQTRAVNFAALFIPVYIFIAICFIHGYFKWDANALMGICLLPYICSIEKRKLSLRYLIPALCSVITAFILPVNTLFFLSILFALLLLVENSYGKVHPVLFFMLILISPLFKNITRLVEFPVRLWLSGKVAALLAASGKAAVSAGNLIILDKHEFAVDPACAGLNMLASSLIICLLLIAFYQRRTGLTLKFFTLIGVLSLTVLLILACNFFRILLLVLFNIMPGDVFHDLIGVGCLTIYVIFPLVVAFRFAINKKGIAKKEPVFAKMRQPSIVLRYPLLHLTFLVIIVAISGRISKADDLYTPGKNPIAPNGFSRKDLNGGIIKLENANALIYIKPTPFYAPEHDPMVCWTGSGYEFKQIREEKINGITIYTGLLQKGTDKIYAAWWFDNGSLKTINQLDWRWQAAKGAQSFYLINANAQTPEKLRTISRWLLNQKHN